MQTQNCIYWDIPPIHRKPIIRRFFWFCVLEMFSGVRFHWLSGVDEIFTLLDADESHNFWKMNGRIRIAIRHDILAPQSITTTVRRMGREAVSRVRRVTSHTIHFIVEFEKELDNAPLQRIGLDRFSDRPNTNKTINHFTSTCYGHDVLLWRIWTNQTRNCKPQTSSITDISSLVCYSYQRRINQTYWLTMIPIESRHWDRDVDNNNPQQTFEMFLAVTQLAADTASPGVKSWKRQVIHYSILNMVVLVIRLRNSHYLLQNGFCLAFSR